MPKILTSGGKQIKCFELLNETNYLVRILERYKLVGAAFGGKQIGSFDFCENTGFFLRRLEETEEHISFSNPEETHVGLFDFHT